MVLENDETVAQAIDTISTKRDIIDSIYKRIFSDPGIFKQFMND